MCRRYRERITCCTDAGGGTMGLRGEDGLYIHTPFEGHSGMQGGWAGLTFPPWLAAADRLARRSSYCEHYTAGVRTREAHFSCRWSCPRWTGFKEARRGGRTPLRLEDKIAGQVEFHPWGVAERIFGYRSLECVWEGSWRSSGWAVFCDIGHLGWRVLRFIREIFEIRWCEWNLVKGVIIHRRILSCSTIWFRNVIYLAFWC